MKHLGPSEYHLPREFFQGNRCPAGAATSSAAGLGNNSAPPRASPGLVAGISGSPWHWFPARSAGAVNPVGLSLGKSRFLGLRKEGTSTLFLIPCGEGNSFHPDDSARPFYFRARWEGRSNCSESNSGLCENGRELQSLCVFILASCVSVPLSHVCASEKPEHLQPCPGLLRFLF